MPSFPVIHRFLQRHSFYVLLAASGLAVALLAGRMHLTQSRTYRFLVWNLFLAWIPYLISLWMVTIVERHPRDWWRVVLPGGLWLLFLPNAPYIMTDLIHLHYNTTTWSPLYDAGLLATVAWTGCFLGVVSLRIVQTMVQGWWGRWVGWLFVLIVAGLCGFGIYLGRVLVWNSWDALLNPRELLRDVLTRLVDPLAHPDMLGITAIFAALFLVCYATMPGRTLNDEVRK